jgi:prepilin-type N-terminal cleavage/methylation domain-containing protein
MKSFRKACRGEKGFTLIELLVVIIILGVLAAVVTLAVTRFIGKGKLESANAELVTVQTAIEAALADGNASGFIDADDDGIADGGEAWSGGAPGPMTDSDPSVGVYDMLRQHNFKAEYTIDEEGYITAADADITNGWGPELVYDATIDKWTKPS